MIKEVIALYTLYVKNQNSDVANCYVPFFGYVKATRSGNPQNPLSTLGSLINKHSDKKALKFNLVHNPFINLWYLHDPETIKAFVLRENDYTIKSSIIDIGINDHFWAKNGKRALFEKGIMNEFFLWENMVSCTKNVKNIINRHLDELVKKEGLTKDSWKEIEWVDYSANVFNDIISLILFGYRENENFPKAFDKDITAAVCQVYELSVQASKKIWNMATFRKFLKYLPGGGIEAEKIKDEV